MNDDPRQYDNSTDEARDRSLIQLKATAYHEAGHAVMALSLGRLVHKVTIVPGRSQFGDSRLGICEMQKGRSAPSKNVFEDEVLILFAGMVAEAHLTGNYCEKGAAQDLLAIERLLCDRSSNQSQFERRRRRLLDKTEHVLRDEGHVLAIELTARELIEKSTISGRAVRHFFNQAIEQSR